MRYFKNVLSRAMSINGKINKNKKRKTDGQGSGKTIDTSIFYFLTRLDVHRLLCFYSSSHQYFIAGEPGIH